MKNFEEIYHMILETTTPLYLPGQSKEECHNIYKFLQETHDVFGDIVEVGVYAGGSAQIINNSKNTDKKLYLFDTFEGWVDCTEFDDGNYVWNGGGGASIDSYDYLINLFKNSNVNIIKGYFPDSAPVDFEKNIFSFIHLDTDTYLSTLKSLEYFWGKLSSGGVILIHDYINDHATGVKTAVDFFLRDKLEKITNLVASQGVIIKY